jgi:hypothetical protein
MTGSQHFITSFAASIFVGTVCGASVFFAQHSLQSVPVSPMIQAVAAFALGHFITRALFKAWVPIKCPYGCGNKAHPIPGRHDRFRCHSCGQDF